MAYLQGNSKHYPSQLDKNETILKDRPMKKSFAKTTVPHLPYNMFQSEPAFPTQPHRGFAKVKADPKHEVIDRFDRGLRRSQMNPSNVHKRLAKPMTNSEKTGAKWGK
uniref:Uncharacterized protein n=1 Tax=Lotharella globosa TaxID=91324 RepID=A0A7S3YZ00_9EUKA